MTAAAPSSAVTEVMQRVWEQIDRDFDRHLAAIQTYLRQPSVSKTGQGVEQCARLTGELIEAAGGSAEIVSTPGHPAVLGRIQGDGPTLLRYGMYDVQPAEEPGWTTPPWAAERHDLPGVGPAIVARGAVNSKGALSAFLLALTSARKVADLPASVVMLCDGEEELGSPHLIDVVEERRADLAADAAFDLDLTADATGTPEVYLGVKGILSYFLTCRGGEWGGPLERAAHSSGGVLIHSPAWSLVRALAALVDGDERPSFEGLPEPVVPASDEPLVDALAEMYDTDRAHHEFRTSRLKQNDARSIVRALLYEAALNVNGIETGYPDGGKTIVPSSARAAIDLRVPAGADLDALDESIRRAIAAVAPEVEVVEDERCVPARTPSNTPVARAMIDSHALEGHPATVWPTAPWWAPYYLFEQILELPFAVGGAGHGAGAHGLDEYASVEGLRQHMRQSIAFLFHFAEQTSNVG
ncbi:MAG: M20/M25/M40 family metallo-hydrolase [Actinomycetota bacterium]